MSTSWDIDVTVVGEHADDLVRVLTLLDVADTQKFWSTIRRRWSLRQFRHAMAQFTESGAVDLFRRVLSSEPRGRKKGHWKSWKNVEAALREFEGELGHFPSSQELRATGRTSLLSAISCYHGGYIKARRRLGADVPRLASGHWKEWENVKEVLLALQQELGRFPRATDVQKREQGSVWVAIQMYHGGVNAVRRRLGVKEERKVNGHWDVWTNVEVELSQLCRELGRFPTAKDLNDHGRGALLTPIQRTHGGFGAVRKRMGVKVDKQPNGYWRSFERVRIILEEFIFRLGRYPTYKELGQAKQYTLLTSLNKYHGGFRAVRDRLGYREDGTPKFVMTSTVSD